MQEPRPAPLVTAADAVVSANRQRLLTVCVSIVTVTAWLLCVPLGLAAVGHRPVIGTAAVACLVAAIIISDITEYLAPKVGHFSLASPFSAALLVVAPLWLPLVAVIVPTALVAGQGKLGVRRGLERMLFNSHHMLLVVLAGRWVYCAVTGGDFLTPSPLTSSSPLAITLASVVMLVLSCALSSLPRLILRLPHIWPRYDVVAAECCLAAATLAAAMSSALTVSLLWIALFYLERSVATAVDRQHASLHDQLTGLANRTQLQNRFQRRRGRRNRSRQAVLLLDLDRFKPVNDTHGHAVGDLLLQHVAQRLRSVLREGDLAARMGGDEFAVLLDLNSAADPDRDIAGLSQRIVIRLSEPYDLDGRIATIGVSVGSSPVDSSDQSIETLLLQADRALYTAKSRRGSWAAYTEDLVAHEPAGAPRD